MAVIIAGNFGVTAGFPFKRQASIVAIEAVQNSTDVFPRRQLSDSNIFIVPSRQFGESSPEVAGKQ